MECNIDELKKTVGIILDNIIDINGNSIPVPIDVDHYWHVIWSERYDLNNTDQELGLGSLSDDIEWVHKLTELDNQKEMFVPQTLEKVAAILQFLAVYGGHGKHSD